MKFKECAIGKYQKIVGIYRDIFGDSAKSITRRTSRGFRSNTTIAGMQTICFDIFPGFSISKHGINEEFGIGVIFILADRFATLPVIGVL